MSTSPRLPASSRFAGALVGAIVTTLGAACIAVYSGRDLDLELLAIAAIAGAGVWLLLSAVATSVSGARKRRATIEDAPKMAEDAKTPATGVELRGAARTAADAARVDSATADESRT